MKYPPFVPAVLGLLLTSSSHMVGLQTAFANDASFRLYSESWVNSGPITAKALGGKPAFLYFFEETWPCCRSMWAGLLTIAQEYQNNPIVFIAVNSGNPRPPVEWYAKDNKITWPIIVDTDRQFEKKADVGEISLNNIFKARIVMAKSDVRRASPANI